MQAHATEHYGAATSWVDTIEETFIALVLGLMTIVTFANVVARYIFNTNILWALETTVFLFAWLVLIGTAYCIKKRSHLGVDVILNLLAPPARRIMALAAAASCVAFSLLLLYGAWQYWLPFAGTQVWYEVNDIPMPDWLRFIEPLLNENEPYEKLPRFIPYFALPLGMTLITFRFLEASWAIWQGRADRLIASHEAEDLVEEAAARRAREPDPLDPHERTTDGEPRA
ncbi:MAG: TRAP transporter small permease [Geminicoccaceae bacterium]|nr:TRAP transporter small permease [Geminicoccaceae bacterium]